MTSIADIVGRDTLIDRLIAFIITWDEQRLNEYIEAKQDSPARFTDIYGKREFVVNMEADWAFNTHSNQDIVDVYPELLKSMYPNF